MSGGGGGPFPTEWAEAGGSTPWWLDHLLRSAAAAVTGIALAGVPGAEPRRPPEEAPGDYATALPMRLAGPAGRPADELAVGIAAELRANPHVVGATAGGRGFVNLALTSRARVSLVRAARGADYLSGGAAPPSGQGEPAVAAWSPSPLHEARTVTLARTRARDDARRRMALAVGGTGGAAGRGGSGGLPELRTSGSPPFTPTPVEGVTWRDPYLDAPVAEGEAARLLAVIGEASARIAFCRSVPERPRADERVGAGLPALPTAERPGNWSRHTDANPAFALRYTHAHAVSSGVWAWESGFGPPFRGGELTGGAVAALEGPDAAGVIGALFDGPGVLSAAAGRGQPHILVRYLESLATAYHEWWESCAAITEENAAPAADAARREATSARLELCAAVAGVLRTGLSLLGVSAPTRL